MPIPCLVIAKAVVVLGVGTMIVIGVLITVHRYTTPRQGAPTFTSIPLADYRLPSNIKPINYKIRLRSSLNESKKMTFDGECFIEIQALQNTKQIQLHILNLSTSLSGYYKKNTNERILLPEATPNNLTDIVVYNLSEELQANVSYILHFIYVGSINDDMRGYYRSKYVINKNETKWFHSIQLQPTNSRSVFPSFDEPGFKATFDITLINDNFVYSDGVTSIVNSTSDEYKYVVFKTTTVMPTYLLNFISYNVQSTVHTKFIVYYRASYKNQAEYILQWGMKLVDALTIHIHEKFTTTTEHKILLKAFSNSAVGESLLLFDKDQSTLKAKQVVASIVTYEIVQLYFGNLVTCKWWSYNWMNEGFATYFQYFATHTADESFDMPAQFVVNVIQTIMITDATNDTHPMSNENVYTKADINHMSSSISFDKGATFIRMTFYILGKIGFEFSLNRYIAKHAYKNTIPSDLFTFWRESCPSQYQYLFKSYFDSFTTQPGYPVVTFNRTTETTVQVSQKRFLLKDFDTADPNITYTIPITYATSSKIDFKTTDPKFFLQQLSKTIPVSKDTTWIIGNIQETGYYRVNYDNQTWNQIYKILNSDSRTEIHEWNRAQIVDDLLNLARAGEIEYSLALYILKYLKFEKEFLPWTSALTGFSYLITRLGNESDIFVPFIHYIIEENYKELGFEEKKGDTTLTIYNRANILAWSCKYGIPECINQAKAIFDEKIATTSVPVNIRSVVYCTVVREGDETNFNTLYNKYMTETIASEKVLILDSLGCVKESKLVEKFVQKIISDDVYPSDKSLALCNLYTKNNKNVDLVFELINKYINQLADATGGYPSVAFDVLKIAEYFTTEAQLEKLNDFIDKHTDKFGVSNPILQKAVKNVQWNLKWSNEKLEKIKDFMKKYI